jgi:hypothetical protein
MDALWVEWGVGLVGVMRRQRRRVYCGDELLDGVYSSLASKIQKTKGKVYRNVRVCVQWCKNIKLLGTGSIKNHACTPPEQLKAPFWRLGADKNRYEAVLEQP